MSPNYKFIKISTIASILGISVGAVFGALLRILLGIIFGTYCEEPELYEGSWLIWKASSGDPGNVGSGTSAFCVTTSGISDQYGGALFVDLPANVLGCFLMGFLQSGKVLNIPSDVNLAFLSATSKAQKWSSLHLGLKTGFCGALTTFSSWNTQMVVMLNGSTAEHGSQGMSVLFGYGIGLQVALAAYASGMHAAMFFHRRVNKAHAMEEDMVEDQKQSAAQMMITQPSDHYKFYSGLPDFERHFLQDILDEKEVEAIRMEFPNVIEAIERWKNSTFFHRKRNFDFRKDLRDLECALICEEDIEMDRLESLIKVADQNSWDVTSLREYIEAKVDMTSTVRKQTKYFGISLAAVLLLVLFILFMIGLNSGDENDEGEKELGINQMLCISGIFAPFGALLRWKLSGLNYGTYLGDRYRWFPFGTFVANITACVIAIALQTALTNLTGEPEENFTWNKLMLKGIQGGFAGSLSTVSTFASETVGMFSALPKHGYAYIYSVGSLVASCIVSTLIYSIWLVNEDD
mmetsp:Transcript_6643/g.8695  ORF Transcript_6643/g.8695 Transcript_6643/m.8695 type:complete len:520 (-) Transcript_6643:485-2044(-)